MTTENDPLPPSVDGAAFNRPSIADIGFLREFLEFSGIYKDAFVTVTASALAFAAVGEKGLIAYIGMALPIIIFCVVKIIQVRKFRDGKRYGDNSQSAFALEPFSASNEDVAEYESSSISIETESLATWIESNREGVSCISGISGSGKSSFINACLIPKLLREGNKVIVVSNAQPDFVDSKGGFANLSVIAPLGDLKSLVTHARPEGTQTNLKAFVIIDDYDKLLLNETNSELQQTAKLLLSSPRPAFCDGFSFVLFFSTESLPTMLSKMGIGPQKRSAGGQMPSPGNASVKLQFPSRWREFRLPSILQGVTYISKKLPKVPRRTIETLVRELSNLDQTEGNVRPQLLQILGLAIGRAHLVDSREVPNLLTLLRNYFRSTCTLPQFRDTAREVLVLLISTSSVMARLTEEQIAERLKVSQERVHAVLFWLWRSGLVSWCDSGTWAIANTAIEKLVFCAFGTKEVSIRRVAFPLVLALGVLGLFIWGWTREVEIRNISKIARLSQKNCGWQEPSKPRGSYELMTLHGANTPTDHIFGDAELAELSTLPIAKNIVGLYLGNTRITALPDMSVFRSLQRLDIQATQISELKGIEKLRQLRWLDISNTLIADLSPVSTLPQIEYVFAQNCRRIDTAPELYNASNIVVLAYQNTKITLIPRLDTYSALWRIGLPQNFSQWDVLRRLPKLDRISLSDQTQEEKLKIVLPIKFPAILGDIAYELPHFGYAADPSELAKP